MKLVTGAWTLGKGGNDKSTIHPWNDFVEKLYEKFEGKNAAQLLAYASDLDAVDLFLDKEILEAMHKPLRNVWATIGDGGTDDGSLHALFTNTITRVKRYDRLPHSADKEKIRESLSEALKDARRARRASRRSPPSRSTRRSGPPRSSPTTARS